MDVTDAKSPWPDEEPDDLGEVTQAKDDTPAGSKGVAFAAAISSLGFWVLLPTLFVIGIYTYVTIYAIVKALGSAPDSPNPTVIIVGMVALTMLFLLLIAGGLALIGRMGDPKKRR